MYLSLAEFIKMLLQRYTICDLRVIGEIGAFAGRKVLNGYYVTTATLSISVGDTGT